MAHPHNEHRDHKVQHRRVHHITGGLGDGGYSHSAAGTDMIKVRKHASKVVHAQDFGQAAFTVEARIGTPIHLTIPLDNNQAERD